MSGANDFIAGCVGGMAGLVVGHPFDTTKVQMQTQQVGHKYKGTMDAIRNISSQGMNRGFFRGMGFPLLSYGFINSVFFGVYGHSLNLFRDPSNPDQKLTYSQIFIAGAIGGAAQLSIGCPVDVVKVVLQAQIPHGDGKAKSRLYYNGPLECSRKIWQSYGIRGFYSGLGVMFIRDLPASSTYIMSYNALGDWMRDRLKCHSTLANFIAGGFAGVLSWAVVMPFDVVKSCIQADHQSEQYKGVKHCLQMIYKSRGLRGFFTGFGVTCLRAFPVNAITLMVYSECLLLMNSGGS